MSNSYSPDKFLVRGRKSYRNPQDMSRLSDSETSDYDEEEFQPENSPDIKHRKRHLSKSISQSRIKEMPTKPHNSANTSDSFVLKAFTVVISSLFFALYALRYISTEKEPTSIDGLKQIFPNQPNETFDDFETIIDEIVFEKEVHPAVFLFLYETNEQKASNLVHHLAKYASQKLNTNQDYIDVHASEFSSKQALNDYGYLISKYKSDLIEKKVMVVKNLHHIPAQTAQVFHSFCDEISPLVERVVYIFTLKVDSLVGKEERIAENNLKRVWNELKLDTLMPLITRVTSTVLKILN